MLHNMEEQDNQSINFSQLDTYTKTCRMQATGASGTTVRTSIPRQFIQKEAEKCGMSIKEFISCYRIKWRYNGFPGIWAEFVAVKNDVTDGHEN